MQVSIVSSTIAFRQGVSSIADLRSAQAIAFEASTDVLIIGAGAAGLIAALRAREAGAQVIVLERDVLPRGSTALSAGLIPAAGTRFQRKAGITDNTQLFAADIMAKAGHEPDPRAVARVVGIVGEALEWLADKHDLPFSLISNFQYPGHSAYRMHGLSERSGAALMQCLCAAAEAAGVLIVTQAHATALYHDLDKRITGVEITRPDRSTDRLGCKALVLASNGYGGNKAMLAAEIPSMAKALYFGHPGNQGDAVIWGRKLGAGIRHLSGHQGHGSVVHPHGILITWATIMQGGFQVNLRAERFSNEAQGYSEAAATVLAQPDALAWTIFDARIAAIARQFEDFRQAETAGAILTADSLPQFAAQMKLPLEAFMKTATAVADLKQRAATDSFGRDWSTASALAPPYHGVRVTGALFHTQGGLVVNDEARVMTQAGNALPNLFAAGGAACGVSGTSAAGYLSGNGLLTAFAYGFIAGKAAADRA